MPLPTLAQPATLKIARIAAVASAIFFILAPLPSHRKSRIKVIGRRSLVQKRHTSRMVWVSGNQKSTELGPLSQRGIR